MATEKIIMAGFGGQGVMSMGQLLTYAGMIEGKQVSWVPAYGPEMRGGTANCSVIVSDSMVGSPIITGDATCAIAMNLPSMLKFEQSLVPGGKLIINSSLVDREPTRKDVEIFKVPANDIAAKVGNPKVANMVMLGAYLALTGIVSTSAVTETLNKVYDAGKEHFIPLNQQALEEGAAAVKKP